MENKKKSNRWIWLLLVLLPPIGILCVWFSKNEMSSKKKKTLTAIFSVWFIYCLIFGRSDATNNYTPDDNIQQSYNEVEEDNQQTEDSDIEVEEDNQQTEDSDIEDEQDGTFDTENVRQDNESDVDSDSSGNADNTSETVFDFSDYDTTYEEVDISNLNVKHGELLSVIYNDGTVVVKTKIEPSYSDSATIAQNYFNVADLVKKHGFNTCEKLSYWAVSDMTNGEESKCISFDLSKEVIDALYNENIVENKLGEYATDLWILPSLLNAEQPDTYGNGTETVASVPEETPVTPQADNTPSPNDGANNFDTYDNADQQNTEAQYVLNTSSMKIHHPSCRSVAKISPSNYATSNASLDELLGQGYTTCGNCF